MIDDLRDAPAHAGKVADRMLAWWEPRGSLLAAVEPRLLSHGFANVFVRALP